MTTPPDWYSDPATPTAQRWWDGLQWTDYTRVTPAPAMPAPPAYVPFQSAPAYARAAPVPLEAKKMAASTRLMKSNVVGFIGVVFAVGSWIFDFWCLVSTAGIVMCIIGLVVDERLRRDGATKTGRGWLIAGIVLAPIALLVHVLLIAQNVASVFHPGL